tara:strand:- start:806 stop:1681 length:876 start_codon:yes stop_codon:yes gene_type:complete
MKGSVLMGGMLFAAAAMGFGFWYSAEKAYYIDVSDVTEVMAYGDAFPVSNYRGIDADTSPLKMRGCFTVDWDYIPTDEYKDIATPLIAPKSFDCFSAKQIDADLEAGNATAILSDENNPYGFDTFIAQYPDGRAFIWRQINDCGDAYFSGELLPNGCPIPAEAAAKNVMRDPNSPLQSLNLTPIMGGAPEEMSIIGKPNVAFSTDAKFYFACFYTSMKIDLLRETYQISDDALPTKPLSDMACYDQGQIAMDVASGAALSLVGERNIIDGIDRIIAVYPDGRAFAWHQKAQ